ncbi:MAG: choice-of-anchor L domain-containing protein [Aeromicrobium sp.]
MSRVPSPQTRPPSRSARRLAASLLVAAVTLVPVLGAVPAANADTGPDLAEAVMDDPALVLTGASITTPDSRSNAVATTPLAGFPTAGSSFAILSSGQALDAYNENTAPDNTTVFGGPSRASGNDRDVTVLKIDVDVPAGANCLSGVDFRFLSEEFPDFVGQGFNDAFIAELDATTWTASGADIDAPNNFAYDSQHNVVSINASGAATMTAGDAEGTTYGGGTGVLTAATPITPGPHSLYFSIFDQGDSAYDSTVLIDNIRFDTVANLATDCGAGAVDPTDEPVTAEAPTTVDEPGTADDSYTIASTTGVTYLVDGDAKAAGTYPGLGTVTVTAEAEDGFTLIGPSSFELTFSAAAPSPVSAEAPTQVDAYGTLSDTYTIAATPGVRYLVGGVVKPAGTYPGADTVTVTAEAEDDFVLTGQDSFELVFTATKATDLTSTGIGTATHTVHPNVPPTAELLLLNADGEGVPSLTVRAEGEYVVDGDDLVFTPALGFSGPGAGVDYLILDGDGNSRGTYVPTVTKPVGPSPEPQTSTGVGMDTQTAAVDVPEGGSVTLRDATDHDATLVTVPGTGTYTIDPATGAVAFVPEAGFLGQATPVTYAAIDAYGTIGTSTYRPTVTVPAPPAPAPITTTGPENARQQVNVPVPPGGTVRLVGPGGAVVDRVVVARKGTYVVNPTTGIITFTPVKGFSGQLSPLTYVVTDSYGQSGRATYSARVAPAPRPGLVVRGHVRSASVVPVTCTLTTRNASGCQVRAFASVSGRRTLLGSGTTSRVSSRTVAVRVVLNRVGRALAARPGGARLQLTATVSSGGTGYQTSGRTQVVAPTVALRTTYFATDSATVTRSDRNYLRSVRARTGAVAKITCTGYADARAGVVYNARLAKARARAVCRVLTQGTQVATRLVSRGEKRPVASNATTRGRSLNRRVEVTLRY